MALSILEDALADYSKRRGLNVRRNLTNNQGEVVADVLTAIQSVIDAITDPRTGSRFHAAFSKTQMDAQTNLGKHVIEIPSTPIFDPNLKIIDAADVLTGLTCHEIGHTIISVETQARLISDWPVKGTDPVVAEPVMHRIANILDDHTLEAMMRRDYPGIGSTFSTVMRWIAKRLHYDAITLRFRPEMNLNDRMNFMISATRYARVIGWSGDALTRSERQWWIDWADRYGVLDVNVRAEGWRVARERLGITSQPEAQIDPPTPPTNPGTQAPVEDDEDIETPEPPVTSQNNGIDDGLTGDIDDDNDVDNDDDIDDDDFDDEDDIDDDDDDRDEFGTNNDDIDEDDIDDDDFDDEDDIDDGLASERGDDGEDPSDMGDDDGDDLSGPPVDAKSDEPVKPGDSTPPDYDGHGLDTPTFRSEDFKEKDAMRGIDQVIEDLKQRGIWRDRDAQAKANQEFKAVKVVDRDGFGTMRIEVR